MIVGPLEYLDNTIKTIKDIANKANKDPTNTGYEGKLPRSEHIHIEVGRVQRGSTKQTQISKTNSAAVVTIILDTLLAFFLLLLCSLKNPRHYRPTECKNRFRYVYKLISHYLFSLHMHS